MTKLPVQNKPESHRGVRQGIKNITATAHSTGEDEDHTAYDLFMRSYNRQQRCTQFKEGYVSDDPGWCMSSHWR
jgi:hypothetical protein